MNFTDLLNEINSNPKINFIASAITPLHIVGIKATIDKLNSQGIALNGYVLNRPHGKTGRLNLQKDFSSSINTIKCVPFDMRLSDGKIPFVKSHLSALKATIQKKHDRTIYILWTKIEYDWLYLLECLPLDYKVVFVIIDDGAGSYNSYYHNELALEIERASRMQKLSFSTRLKTYIKISMMVMYDKLLMSIVKFRGNFIDNRIFTTNHKNEIRGQNELIADYYIRAFELSISEKDLIKEKHLIDGCILFNTQCLSESGLTDGVIDYELYRKAVDISKQYCGKVVVKPHPRENNVDKYENLGINVLITELTQESLLSIVEQKPICVVSIFSSTLLNAKGLFGIQAVSLAKIMLKYEVSKELKSLLEEFVSQYSSIILFPSSFEEYAEILKKEIKK